MSDQFIRFNKRTSLAGRVAKLQSEVKELWADCEQLKREKAEAIQQTERWKNDYSVLAGSFKAVKREKAEAIQRAEKAEKIAIEAVSILADAHDEDSGCSFTLDIDAEDSGVGCFACLAQLKLAEITGQKKEANHA